MRQTWRYDGRVEENIKRFKGREGENNEERRESKVKDDERDCHSNRQSDIPARHLILDCCAMMRKISYVLCERVDARSRKYLCCSKTISRTQRRISPRKESRVKKRSSVQRCYLDHSFMRKANTLDM